MEELKFKTTIKCTGCLEKVTPGLNNASGVEKWDVDLRNPDKVLTVKAISANDKDIVKAVKKAGFEIERIKST